MLEALFVAVVEYSTRYTLCLCFFKKMKNDRRCTQIKITLNFPF